MNWATKFCGSGMRDHFLRRNQILHFTPSQMRELEKVGLLKNGALKLSRKKLSRLAKAGISLDDILEGRVK